jgi:adenylate cyclase
VRLSAPGGVDERIVIIAIDEPSLEIHGHWPWTREKLALLLDQLFAAGVAVVGFDMVFPERDDIADMGVLRQLAAEKNDQHFLQRLEEFEPALDRDNRFAEVLASGPAILGYYFDTNKATAYETGALPVPAFELHESMMESVFLPRAEGFTSNLPVLMEATYGAGFISNPLIDDDGVVRRAPMLHEYKLAVYESLSLSVAATYFNDIALPVFVDASRWMGWS